MYEIRDLGWLKGRYLEDVIKEEITRKWGDFRLDFPLYFRIFWKGGKRFEVYACQDKWGADINCVQFQIKMGKKDVKRYLNEITKEMSKDEFEKFINEFGADIL